MTLEIPYHLADEVQRLVNDHKYTPEAAVAKAAYASVGTQEPRRATEGAAHEETPVSRTPGAQRANTRRRTPKRDPMPEDAPVQPLNEKQFTQMVLYVLRAEGWLAYHTFDSRRSEPGFPDIVAVHPERGIIFAELKMRNGTVSEHQQRWLDAIQAAGGRAYLWYPADFATIEAVAQGKQA